MRGTYSQTVGINFLKRGGVQGGTKDLDLIVTERGSTCVKKGAIEDLDDEVASGTKAQATQPAQTLIQGICPVRHKLSLVT